MPPGLSILNSIRGFHSRAKPRIRRGNSYLTSPESFACISRVNCLMSSALYDPVGMGFMLGSPVGLKVYILAPTICFVAIAYFRDRAAGVPSPTAGSTSVVTIEIVLSVLRYISKVRNCWGKSLSDEVSTCQKPFSGALIGSGDGNALTVFR